MVVKNIGSCASCHYPLAAAYSGQTVSCPMCSTVNQAITGVDIPTPIFWGALGLLAGFIIGRSKVVGAKLGRL